MKDRSEFLSRFASRLKILLQYGIQYRRRSSLLRRICRSALISSCLIIAIPGVVSAESITLLFDHLNEDQNIQPPFAGGFQTKFVTVNTVPFTAYRDAKYEESDLVAPDSIQIALFNGETITAVFDQVDMGSLGSVIWIGHVKGAPGDLVMISVLDSVMQGNIAVAGERYELRFAMDQGGVVLHTLTHVDPLQATPEHDPNEPPLFVPPFSGDDAPLQSGDDSGAFIDVVLLYTADAQAGAGGAGPMSTLIDLAFSETNIGYQNSNVNHRINLVRAELTSYVESGSTSTDLTRLQGTTDGYMDDVHVTRDFYSADLVHLFGDYVGISCGRAYVGGGASWAFGLTSYHCATGNYSFGHEIGHNMTALHDRQTQGQLGNSVNYNYGYYYPSENWRTIMSYNNAACVQAGNCTRLNYWSNPNVPHPTTSTPMGIAEGTTNAAENWKTLNNAAYAVANYREAGDAYEDDNTSTTASYIEDGIAQPGRSIHEGGSDVDWVAFDMSCDGTAIVETSGAAGDTVMTMYDSALNVIDMDDDDGIGFFSRIEFPLDAGSYFVKIESFSSNDSINDYELTFDQVCDGFFCNGRLVNVNLNLGQSTTPSDDVVMGTPGNDDIRGKAGNDTICGMGGDDFIHGNSGDDWIDGGDGVDNIRGGQGNDVILTGLGSTVGTASRAFGGTGDDDITGDIDDDDIRGGRGNDTINGRGGNDELRGNDDNDTMNGGLGDDEVLGGQGDDNLNGGQGADNLDGGSGDDELSGGAGSPDVCDGGTGTDTVNASCESVLNVP